MNFDVKLNTLDKELTKKVFSKTVSSTLPAILIYRKHHDFLPLGEHSGVKGERDTKVDFRAQPIEISYSYYPSNTHVCGGILQYPTLMDMGVTSQSNHEEERVLEEST